MHYYYKKWLVQWQIRKKKFFFHFFPTYPTNLSKLTINTACLISSEHQLFNQEVLKGKGQNFSWKNKKYEFNTFIIIIFVPVDEDHFHCFIAKGAGLPLTFILHCARYSTYWCQSELILRFLKRNSIGFWGDQGFRWRNELLFYVPEK